jgi:hypothetical protein
VLLVFHKRLKVSLKIYISIVVFKLMAVLFCIHVISSRFTLPCGNMNGYQHHYNEPGIIKIMFKKVLAKRVYWDIPVLCCYVSCVVICTGWLRCDLCRFVLQWFCHRYLHRIVRMRVVDGGVNDVK